MGDCAAGIAMIDARDIADVTVVELLRRNHVLAPAPRTALNLDGPELLTGASVPRPGVPH